MGLHDDIFDFIAGGYGFAVGQNVEMWRIVAEKRRSKSMARWSGSGISRRTTNVGPWSQRARKIKRGRGGFQPFRAAIRAVQGAAGVRRSTTRLAGVTQRPRAAAARMQASGEGGHQIANSWVANGVPFTQMTDGHIVVQRKNGTIKHYRPYKPVVIPKKWNAKSMRRVATALKGMRKTAGAIMQLTGGYPGANAARTAKALAAAEAEIHHKK